MDGLAASTSKAEVNMSGEVHRQTRTRLLSLAILSPPRSLFQPLNKPTPCGPPSFLRAGCRAISAMLRAAIGHDLFRGRQQYLATKIEKGKGKGEEKSPPPAGDLGAASHQGASVFGEPNPNRCCMTRSTKTLSGEFRRASQPMRRLSFEELERQQLRTPMSA